MGMLFAACAPAERQLPEGSQPSEAAAQTSAAQHYCTEWKEQADGTKARLYTSKESWRAGEEVQISMELWNTGETEIKIPASSYKTINIYVNGKAVADEIGEESDAEVYTVPPGEKYSFELTHLRTHTPGVYSIGGSFGKITLPEFSVDVK
jgi:hypothetical protein